MNYEPEVCSECGQTKTYLLAMDQGTVDIVVSISNAIREKGINVIHPRKEMEINKKQTDYDSMIEQGELTSNMVGNLSRPRFHGLIAKTADEPGNYCLTRKGLEFLKGKKIPKYAIISKVSSSQIGYWKEEEERISIKDYYDKYWSDLGFKIREGRVIIEIMKNTKENKQTFLALPR